MNKESLEDISRLRSLEAENRHLKNLLNKVASSPKNKPDSSDLDFEALTNSWFENSDDYKSVITVVLKELGDKVGVDRVSIYTFQQDISGYCMAYQYAKDNIQEYHSSDLIIDVAENPLAIPGSENAFYSTNLAEDLSESLSQKFEMFQVQSILVLPFEGLELAHGMIILESCAFNREWYKFEIDEISRSVKQIATSLSLLGYRNSSEQDSQLRELLGSVTGILNSEFNPQWAVNKILSKIGEKLGLVASYILNKDGLEYKWVRQGKEEEVQLSISDVEKLLLKDKEDSTFLINQLDLIRADVKLASKGKVLIIRLNSVYNQVGYMVCEFDLLPQDSETKYIKFIDSISQVIHHLIISVQQKIYLTSKYRSAYEANKVLEQKSEFLDNLLLHSPMGIVVVKNNIITYANLYILNLCGYAEPEMIGQGVSFLFNARIDEENVGQIDRVYDKVFDSECDNGELRVLNKNGVERVICVNGVKDVEANDNSGILFISDITERIKIKKNLSELRDRYSKILESSIDGVIIIDDQGQIKFINKSARDLLGYSLKEVESLVFGDLFEKNKVGVSERALRIIEEEGKFRTDASLLKKNGKTNESEICGTCIGLDGVNHYYFTIHDISARKKNEQILTQREKEFRTLAENSPDIILRLNKKGQVLFYNMAFIEQFNFLNEESVAGKSLTDLGILDELVGSTWQAKIDDVFLFRENLSMELGFSDETNELYYDWIMTPETDNTGGVSTLLAIGRNVMARKNVERELMESKVKAEESEKLKTSFLANMSHELRTPLNAIVGFSALLRGNDISAEEKEVYVDVIHKNSDSLMSMINNIIDVAKIESGKISVEKEKVNLNVLLDSLYNDFLPRIELEHKGRVKLYLSKPEGEEINFVSDPIRLRQVLVNLIGNAIKFTIKGFIEFGYEVVDTSLKIFVRDTGIGISEAKQKLIFEPFRKEAESENQIYRGTGIGLSICEKIVNALGGKIGLFSEKGQGAEFFFTHPVEMDSEANNYQNNIRKTITFSQPVLPKNYHWPNKLVLLVDENSSAHLQIRKLIEKTGLTLVSARTAAGASRLLQNRKDIHLVLMDLKFPDADGFELVRIIKHQNNELPIIAHTVKAVNGEKKRLIEGGFDACVAKPTEKEELLMVMDRFLLTSE